MRFSSFVATVFIAFAGFTFAMPSADADLAMAQDGALSDMFEIEARACRKLGAACTRDRQCCSTECDDGRCKRHGGGGDDGIAARACRKLGATCTRDRQCCSTECDDGRCKRHGGGGDDDGIAARACRKLGAACTRDRQCCSTECDDGFCKRHGGGGDD